MRRSQEGFTTVQYVVASGLSLVLFVLLANVLVDMYQRGAVRDALDEGVRAAVPAGTGPHECESRARDVVRDIAGGSLLRVESLDCERRGDRVVAQARVSLRSWLPVVPPWRLELRASAVTER